MSTDADAALRQFLEDLAERDAARRARHEHGLQPDPPTPIPSDGDPSIEVDESPTELVPNQPRDDSPTRVSFQSRITEHMHRSQNDEVTLGHIVHQGELAQTSVDTEVQILAEVRAIRHTVHTVAWWLMAIGAVLGVGGILAGAAGLGLAVAGWWMG